MSIYQLDTVDWVTKFRRRSDQALRRDEAPGCRCFSPLLTDSLDL